MGQKRKSNKSGGSFQESFRFASLVLLIFLNMRCGKIWQTVTFGSSPRTYKNFAYAFTNDNNTQMLGYSIGSTGHLTALSSNSTDYFGGARGTLGHLFCGIAPAPCTLVGATLVPSPNTYSAQIDRNTGVITLNSPAPSAGPNGGADAVDSSRTHYVTTGGYAGPFLSSYLSDPVTGFLTVGGLYSTVFKAYELVFDQTGSALYTSYLDSNQIPFSRLMEMGH